MPFKRRKGPVLPEKGLLESESVKAIFDEQPLAARQGGKGEHISASVGLNHQEQRPAITRKRGGGERGVRLSGGKNDVG